MRTTSIVILAIVLFASTNALTAQKIIAAINFARKYPKIIAQRIQAQFPNTKGWDIDPTCYSDAITFLNAQAPLPPLKENLAADLSTYLHSKYCAQVFKGLTHRGVGNSDAGSRLAEVATGGGGWNEIIAEICRPNPVFPPAEEYIMMWINDCSVPSRGHRNSIFATYVTHIGCGAAMAPPNGPWYSTVVTCMGTNAAVIKPEARSRLAEAGLCQYRNGYEFTGV